TDVHLLTLVHHDPVHDTGVVGGAAAAPAAGIHRQDLYPIGELHEPLGTGKELPLEIGEDPVAVHVDTHTVDDPGELTHLLEGQELCLVHDHVGHLAVGDVVVQIKGVPDLHGGGLQPQAGGDDPKTGPVLLGVEQ